MEQSNRVLKHGETMGRLLPQARTAQEGALHGDLSEHPVERGVTWFGVLTHQPCRTPAVETPARSL